LITLDAGFHRHDDVDGFFTIAIHPPVWTKKPGNGEKDRCQKITRVLKNYSYSSCPREIGGPASRKL